MADFSSASDVVGKFLPKIYTRRITLEDSNIIDVTFEKKTYRYFANARRAYVKKKVITPATAVTVDYHIKDLLSESGLGIITKNSEDQQEAQDRILSSLKVVLILFRDEETSRNAYDAFYQFSLMMQNFDQANFIESFPSLKEYIDVFATLGDDRMVKEIQGRPQELNFQVRNSRYQQYDVNNNPINIIPYNHTFRIDNESWSNGDNLSLLAFTYFDFSDLGMDDLMNQTDIKKLSWFMGDISHETITKNGQVESTTLLYSDFETNEPYYGPVHQMEDGRYMSGIAHGLDTGGRLLTRTRVPMRKIQDFRAMQRTALVNYQPGALESFMGRSPSLRAIEGQNRDFFGLESVIVDLDRTVSTVDIQFSANLADMYKFNSRYYEIFKNSSLGDQRRILDKMKILSMQVLRRRVTKHSIGHGNLGAPKRIDYDQEQLPVHLVAQSGHPSDVDVRNYSTVPIVQFRDENGVLVQMDNPVELPADSSASRFRTFYANDLQIRNMMDTGGVYQYGVKFIIKDDTRNFFIDRLKDARIYLTSLKQYLEECQVPVFDTRYVVKVDESQATTLDLFAPPSYADDIRVQGNYDTATKTFTDSFASYAERKYFSSRRLEAIILNYLSIVKFSFAKANVSISYGDVSIERDAYQSAIAEDLLERDNVFRSDASIETLENMLHPRNARPESILSFIKSYEDLILEMERYFDFTDRDNTIEGAGFSGKHYNDFFEVERWFASTVKGIDEDNYIYLDSVYENKVFTVYDIGTPDLFMPRTISTDALNERFQREYINFGSTPTSVAAISPVGIVIGNDKIMFHEDDISIRRAEQLEKYLSENLPGYKMRRIIPLSKGIGDRSAELNAEQNNYSVNRFLTKLYALPNQAVLNAIGTLNNYDIRDAGIDYFSFMNSIQELFRDNAIEYGPELRDFTTLLDRQDKITEIECDGVTLRAVEEEEIVDLGEVYKNLQSAIITTQRNLIPVENIRIPDILPGVRNLDKVKSILDRAMNPMPRIPVIPQLSNLNAPALFADGVITLEKNDVLSATGAGKRLTPNDVTTPGAGGKLLLGKGAVSSTLNSGGNRSGFKVSSEVSGITVKSTVTSGVTAGNSGAITGTRNSAAPVGSALGAGARGAAGSAPQRGAAFGPTRGAASGPTRGARFGPAQGFGARQMGPFVGGY